MKSNPKALKTKQATKSASGHANAVANQTPATSSATRDAAASQQLVVAAPSETSPNATYYASLRDRLRDLELNCPEFNGTQAR